MSTVADFSLVADSPPMTVEEFLALPENGVHRELIQGRVREMGMTVRNRFHSRIEARIVQRLLNWLDQQPQPHGEVVCGEAGFRLKGTKESLVGIDVALVSHELILPRQESFASLHILTRRASEGSEALPSLARRVRMSFFGARVIDRTEKKEAMYDGPPILAVEILSPSDKHQDTVDTVATYLEGRDHRLGDRS